MKAIAVLGTGPSINLFRNEEPYKFDLTVGVNDIWKYVKTDYIVCLDHPKAFNPERIKIINESRPKGFYSQIVIWDYRKDFIKIKLENGYPDRICNLDTYGFQKSFMSPFVAFQIAWKFHEATEIHVYGVDLVNHPHLDRPLCGRIKRHFENLKSALKVKGCEIIVHGSGILTC